MEKKKNIFARMKEFLKDVRAELKKVTWPTRGDLYKTTIAVIVSSVFFGIFLFVVDLVFSKLINKVIELLK
jgi:preprotein translocase subunit SecE